MALVAGLALTGCQTTGPGFGSSAGAGASPTGSGFHAAVAADQARAATVARAVLSSGGHAADAAAAMGLATAAALGPTAAGACVVHDGQDQTSYSLDFVSGGGDMVGGRALGGMRAIHARWGKQPWTAVAGAAGAAPHIGADSPPPVTTAALPGPPIGPVRPRFVNTAGGVVASDVLLGMEQEYFIVASPPDRTHMLADATYRALTAVKNGLKDPPPGSVLRGKALMQGYSHKHPTQGAPANPPDAARPAGQSFVIVDYAGFAIACSFVPAGGTLGASPAVLLDVTDRAVGAIAATGRAAAPALAQTIAALGQEDFPLDDALERPRLTADAGMAELEPDAGDSAYALEERGWKMTKRADLARLAAVWKGEAGWVALADPRGKGSAATLTGAMLSGGARATTATKPTTAPPSVAAPTAVRPAAAPTPAPAPAPASNASPARTAGVWSPVR